MWLILTFFFVPGILSIKVYKDIVHGEVFVEDWEPHKNVSEHIVEFAAEMAPYYFAANYDDYGEFRTEKVRDTRYEIDKVVKHHWREVTYRSIDDVKQKFHYEIIPYAKNYRLAHGEPLPANFEDDIMNFLEDLRFKYIRMFISRNATRHDQVYIPLFVEMTIIRARLTPRVLLIRELYDLVEDESAPRGGETTAALDELKNAQKKIDKAITDLGKAVLPDEAAATTSVPVTTTTEVTTVAPKTETPPTTEAPAPETTEETATEATTEIVTEETPKVEEVTTEEPKTTTTPEATTTTPEATTTTEEPTTTEATTEEAVTEATKAPEVTEETTTEEPVTEETVTEEPTVEETTEEATEAPETETPPETETAGEEETTEEPTTEESVTEEAVPEEAPTEAPETLIEDSVDTVEGGHGDGANDEEAETANEEAEDFAAESPREVDVTYATPVEPGSIILLDE